MMTPKVWRSPVRTCVGVRGPAQQGKVDLIIRGGTSRSQDAIDAVMDVAIAGGKIAEVSVKIDASRASRVADATGLYVVPGLIDIHTHVFYGTEDTYLSNGHVAVQPDAHAPQAGVTTVVDVGGAGWRNFDQFKRNIIDRSLTRVLSFINIVGSGMKGGPFEQDLSDMNASLRHADPRASRRDRRRQDRPYRAGVGSGTALSRRAARAGASDGDFGTFLAERRTRISY